MTLSSENLSRIQQAATLGTDPKTLDVEWNDEAQQAYDSVLAEINNSAGREMIEQIFDWPDDTYDELIEQTWAAHGKPKTLDEMQAEAESDLDPQSDGDL